MPKNWFQTLLHPFDDEEEDGLEEYEYTKTVPEPVPVQKPAQTTYGRTTTYGGGGGGYSSAANNAMQGVQIKSVHATAQFQVALFTPEKYEKKIAEQIGEHLRLRRTVVLNLEKMEKGQKLRLLDFLTGVAFALDGSVKKVTVSTVLVVPMNVDLTGDFLDDLENNTGELFFPES